MSKKIRKTKILSQRWFKMADEDLLFAKAGWKESGISGHACFMCQQIVEKYLKGFLVSQNINPPRIHDLPKILEMCIEIDGKFRQFTDECEILSGYYIAPRYPLDMPQDYSKEQVEEAFEIVDGIKDFVNNISPHSKNLL